VNDIARMRREYADTALGERDLAPDWLSQFQRWFAEISEIMAATGANTHAAMDAEPRAAAGDAPGGEPNAMIVATATRDGVPSARTVLLKGFDRDGFTFFTNYESRKGRELAENPRASLVFPWYPLHRQVVVCGGVERVSRDETEKYFAVRPHDSQVGAWASPQSRVIPSRDSLEESWAAMDETYPEQVPAPPHWGGFRVRPVTVEFWQGRPNRMHDRLRYRLDQGTWIVERLAP
jgi:pyridoxamine 5'-phosphate oxidase